MHGSKRWKFENSSNIVRSVNKQIVTNDITSTILVTTTTITTTRGIFTTTTTASVTTYTIIIIMSLLIQGFAEKLIG